MTTYDIYQYIFIGTAILCGIMAVITILLFFTLKIPQVIGDLTGSTARKAIEAIRLQNESSGNKTYKTSLVNQERGKITDKISPSGNLLVGETDPLSYAMATEKLETQQLNETEVLNNMGSEETAILSQSVESSFVIESEITFIHTNEIIEPEYA